MSKIAGPVYKSPVANSIPYDDTIQTPLTNSNTVQEILDYLKNQVTSNVSPGFTWGRSGAIPANTYLLNDAVPSNVSGRIVFLNNAMIKKVYVANQDATANIILGVYSHDGDGNNMTLLGTVTTTAARSNTFSVTWSVAINKQLAVKLETTSASGKNLVVGILMNGSV